MVDKIYLLVVCMAMLYGLSLTSSLKLKSWQRYKRDPGRQIKKLYQILTTAAQYDEIFERAGIRLSMSKYLLLRKMVVGLLFLLELLIGVRSVPRSVLLLCILGGFWWLSKPLEYTKSGKPTYFKRLLLLLGRKYDEKKNEELMKLATQLKNLIVSQADNPWAAEHVVEALLQSAEITKPAFVQALVLMRLSRLSEAAKKFRESINTQLGDEFSFILAKLEALEPADFLQQIQYFQQAMREGKRTRQQKKQEAASRRIFTLASLLVAAIMFNYMYIMFAYLMQLMII